MGRDADNAGAAYVSQWYARNCYIFSNILSVLSRPIVQSSSLDRATSICFASSCGLNLNLRDVDPLQYLNA